MIDHKQTFEKYGYKYDELSDGSKRKIIVICDYCNNQLEKTKKDIFNSNKVVNKDACIKCRFKKREEVSLATYGVSNSAQREDVRKKSIKSTNNMPEDFHEEIINLLQDGHSMTHVCKELKLSNGTLSRYCKKHNIVINSTVQSRREKTMVDRYGPNYKRINYEKYSKSVQEKYGVDNAFQSDEIKAKSKQTCLEKYGVEYSMQDKEIKNRSKQTCLEKYGVENPSQNPEIKQKIRETNLQRYGYECVTQVPEIKQKSRETSIKNGHMREFNGYSVKEMAEENGFCRSRMDQLVRTYGFEAASKMTPKCSSLEAVVSQYFDESNISYNKHFRVDGRISDFLLDNNVIIEVDGNYWHSDANHNLSNPKYYHRDKRNVYIKNNYKPLFFREDEVINKFPIVKSVILNALGTTETKIGARKCTIEILDKASAKESLITNHLMGHGAGTTYALVYQGNPVSYLQIKCIKGNNYEISRFCHNLNTNVVGGFSRLLKHVETNTPNIESIKTFIDLRYGTGHYLESLGFVPKKPHVSFKWVKNMEVYNRMKFRGNMGKQYGFAKLWDCGQKPFIKEI